MSNSNDEIVYYEDAFGRLWVKSDTERPSPPKRPNGTTRDGVQYEWAPLGGPGSVDDLKAMGLVPGRWVDGLRPWEQKRLTEKQQAFVDAVRAATGCDIEPLLKWERDAATLSIGSGYFLRVLHNGVATVVHASAPYDEVMFVGQSPDGVRMLSAVGCRMKCLIKLLKALHRSIGLVVSHDDIEGELLSLQAEMTACLDDIEEAASAVAIGVSDTLAGVRAAVDAMDVDGLTKRLLAAVTAPPPTFEKEAS